MYEEFYGLSDKPFGQTPDPRFLYFTPSHREALNSTTEGIKHGRGFISITGEAGTGKTTLIYSLLNRFDENVKIVYISHSTVTFEELLYIIFLELGLSVVEESKPAFLSHLAKYLTQMIADETIAIIIDEAQSLREEVMRDLQMFSNLAPKVQIVLVGQPELEDKLDSQGLSQFKKRISLKRQIRGLIGKEPKGYIDHRLRLVGRSSSEIFTPKAISMICSYAGGIPRLINKLCDDALLAGYHLSQRKIDVDIIRRVIMHSEGRSLQKTMYSSVTAALRGFRSSSFRLKLPARYDCERDWTIQPDVFRCRGKVRAPRWVGIG